MKRLLAIAILLTAGCRAGDATVSRTGLRESTEPGSANPIGLTESGSVRAVPHSPFIIPHADRVFLTAAALKELCAPVHLDPPGETLDEVAKKLGTTPIGLRNARLNGVFDVHHVKGLMGRRGRPVPLLYTPRPLDPSAKNFAEPDAAWLWTAKYLVALLPAGFEQTLTRIECFRPHVARTRYADEESIHPEARDGSAPPRKSRRLPPPQPDHVWYKWSRSGHRWLSLVSPRSAAAATGPTRNRGVYSSGGAAARKKT